MTSSPHGHRAQSLAHLDACTTARDTLAELYARGSEAPRHLIASLHDSVRLGAKLAQVHALLAIESRLAEPYALPAHVTAELRMLELRIELIEALNERERVTKS